MTKREWEERAATDRRLMELGIDRTGCDGLRRAARTLHRWAELKCGDEWGSAIERDETTGKPFLTREPFAGTGRRIRTQVTDREAGALRRIRGILEPLGLHFYHQGDPRGCALYIGREPFPDFDYSRGIPVW